VHVRDEEVAVGLLGFYWAARAPGCGTAEFYRRRFLRLPKKSGETIDCYFCFTPREWSLPLSLGWDSGSICIGLLCWQLEVWYERGDPVDMPESEGLRRLFGGSSSAHPTAD
jgi:hypothetical protein